MSESRSESYKAAGVDVTAGYEAVKLMKPMVESTFTKGVIGTLGGFGGLFRPDFKGMADPILVSGTDGVGTKLKLAFLMDKHDTVGIDCVAMCVNDIACRPARRCRTRRTLHAPCQTGCRFALGYGISCYFLLVSLCAHLPMTRFMIS